MRRHTLVLSLIAVVKALPHATSRDCRLVDIPVEINIPRYIINTTINNDWDATALTFNLTRRNVGSAADPLPISGMTDPITSTYIIGVTLCGTGGPTLILTHGIIESKLYWDPTFTGADNYNFINAALTAGYSVLNYDRIGVGSSSKVDALYDAQFQVETAVLNSLVDYARNNANASKIALVGHSYGSYLSIASASEIVVDALVLTGFSGTTDYFGPFLAGSNFRVARIADPQRWGNLDSGYLTSSDLYAETYVYFANPYFEHRVAEWTYYIASEPFAVGELPTLLATNISYSDITAPVMILQGQFDVSACGGDCVGLLNDTKALFTGSSVVETVDDLRAGHNLNLHTVAPQAFQQIFSFIKAQGI